MSAEEAPVQGNSSSSVSARRSTRRLACMSIAPAKKQQYAPSTARRIINKYDAASGHGDIDISRCRPLGRHHRLVQDDVPSTTDPEAAAPLNQTPQDKAAVATTKPKTTSKGKRRRSRPPERFLPEAPEPMQVETPAPPATPPVARKRSKQKIPMAKSGSNNSKSSTADPKPQELFERRSNGKGVGTLRRLMEEYGVHDLSSPDAFERLEESSRKASTSDASPYPPKCPEEDGAPKVFLEDSILLSKDLYSTESDCEDYPQKLAPPDFPENDASCTWHWDKANRIVRVSFLKPAAADAICHWECLLGIMERDDLVLVMEGIFSLPRSDGVHHDENAFLLGQLQNMALPKYLKSKSATGEMDEQEVSVFSDLSLIDGSMFLDELPTSRYLPMLDAQVEGAWNSPMMLNPGSPSCASHLTGETCLPETYRTAYLSMMGISKENASSSHLVKPLQYSLQHGMADKCEWQWEGRTEYTILPRLRPEQVAEATSAMKARQEYPTKSTLKEWRRLDLFPMQVTLEPGQIVFINKGRLYCSRALRGKPLASSDRVSTLWKTISWYWSYIGCSSSGMARELECIMAQERLTRRHKMETFYSPRLFYYRLFDRAVNQVLSGDEFVSSTGFFGDYHAAALEPHHEKLLQGIFPSMQRLLEDEMDNIEQLIHHASLVKRVKRFHKTPKLNADPQAIGNIDPMSNKDFYCRLCHAELINLFLHCDGCEIVAKRDFDICFECFRDFKYATYVCLSPSNEDCLSHIHHTGHFDLSKSMKCKYGNPKGSRCRHCGKCRCCLCSCHSFFSAHLRFWKLESLQEKLERARKAFCQLAPQE